MTSAALDDHIRICLDDDPVVDVDVENGERPGLRWNTTWRRCGSRVDRVDETLDDGVIGHIEMRGQGIDTFA